MNLEKWYFGDRMKWIEKTLPYDSKKNKQKFVDLDDDLFSEEYKKNKIKVNKLLNALK